MHISSVGTFAGTASLLAAFFNPIMSLTVFPWRLHLSSEGMPEGKRNGLTVLESHMMKQQRQMEILGNSILMMKVHMAC